MKENNKHAALVTGHASPSEIARTEKHHPLVSVIIPAYNAGAFITETLNSVIAQTHQSLEILVVDDGSHDDTVLVVEAIASKDSRIELLRQSNGGAAAARNAGIQKAKGEFVAPIDADDVWHPETVEKLVEQFEKGSNKIGVVYAWSLDIDEQGVATGGFHASAIKGYVYKTLIYHNFVGNASATLIRTACLKQTGGYSTQLKARGAQGCEDWELYLRLAEQFDFGVVPVFLVGYRKNSDSMSQNYARMARSQQLMLEPIKTRHPEISSCLYRFSRGKFYLYLASQCHQYSSPQATLYWLWQAGKVEPVTSLSWPGTYTLLFKTIVKQLLNQLVLSSRRSAKGKVPKTSQRRPLHSLPNQPDPANSFDFMSASWAKSHRLRVRFEVYVGLLLHHSLSIT